MIRINLLSTERKKPARAALSFDPAKQLTLACSLILVVAAGGIGWRYWSLTQEADGVEQEIVAAQQEVARLRPIIAEVGRFEGQRQRLQQRVQLIAQLRQGQGIPVQMLDQVSRSLPDMMWLTSMQQDGADVTIEGFSTTLIGLSDFVGNLASTDFFKKPIEIVDSRVDSGPQQTAGSGAAQDLIRFTVKAQLAKAPAAGGAPAKR